MTVRVLMMLAAASVLAACEKAPAPVDLCPAPRLTAHEAPQTYGGQRELANICIKTRARELTRAGGPVAQAGREAVAACAPEQARALAALRRLGPVWPYQRAILTDEYDHVGLLAATQARSIGCGLKAGEQPDRLPGAKWD